MVDAATRIAAIALLADQRSPKRRSGAKRLRKLRDPSVGPALLEALRREVQDSRTWETQYQMIMALGECGYQPALSFLDALARQPFEATMVYVALGDAIIRLGQADKNDATSVLSVMASTNDMLIDGALRAVAMLRLRPNNEAITRIISYAARRPLEDESRLWVAAAAAGWDGSDVQAFLKTSVASPREDVKRAAQASLQKIYLTWNPL